MKFVRRLQLAAEDGGPVRRRRGRRCGRRHVRAELPRREGPGRAAGRGAAAGAVHGRARRLQGPGLRGPLHPGPQLRGAVPQLPAAAVRHQPRLAAAPGLPALPAVQVMAPAPAHAHTLAPREHSLRSMYLSNYTPVKREIKYFVSDLRLRERDSFLRCDDVRLHCFASERRARRLWWRTAPECCTNCTKLDVLSCTLHNLKYSFRNIFAYGNNLVLECFFFYTDMPEFQCIGSFT